MDALNQLWSEASTKMYEQASQAQPNAESTADAGTGAAENVEDADFTVVDEK